MAPDEDLAAKWSTLLPKLRDRWPRVPAEDWEASRGDLEALLKNVAARYPALTRSEVLSELTTLMERPEIVED
ncbi:MAG TPA: hypothetical protein VGK88_01190 [bacterium]|jgi:hypothetical protein